MKHHSELLCLRERFLASVLFILIILFSGKLQAQVTIGSSEKANHGALLDVKESNNLGANSTKGLMLPRVNLVTTTTLSPEDLNDPATPVFDGVSEHVGLWVYNMTDNTGYAMRDNEDMLCPGPYVWDESRWVRLWPACLCEYTVIGRNGQVYNILCNDFEDVAYTDALDICKRSVKEKYTYHMMTYDEYDQMWSQPVSVNGNATADFSFAPGIQFFVHKKSNISSPLGWITIAFQSDMNTREVLGWNRGTISSLTSGYFPGGTPIGAFYGKATVRCVRDY